MACLSAVPNLVSIMMPAFNAKRFIGEAIESVIAQTFPNWELVVVDDGSTDDTAAAAEASGDSRVRVVRQANRGEAAARNTALDHVRGEFLAFLDADDVYLPNHLELTVGHLTRHPEHDGVYTNGHVISSDGRRLKSLADRRRRPVTGRVFDEVVRGSDLLAPPVSVVLRREPLVRAGLRFDERIVIGPDWDFFVRFADAGAFGYLDEPTCLYRVHDSNITVRTDSTRRALDLARCRMKAIRLPSFAACPDDVRFNAFHDLVVHLLRDQPAQQDEVLRWPEFGALTSANQALLLRLAAGEALLNGSDLRRVQSHLKRARRANPADWRAALLLVTCRIAPRLSRFLVCLRRGAADGACEAAPFADLQGKM